MGDETRGPLREVHSSRRYDISRLSHSDRREQLLSYGDLDLGWAGPGRSDAGGAASDHPASSSHDFSVRASAFLQSDPRSPKHHRSLADFSTCCRGVDTLIGFLIDQALPGG
jgi:hypothetical protein